MSANGEGGAPPWGDDNPCPDCKTGICHRCGKAKWDALLAPHMGVVLCNSCFGEGFK
jgi:hypothetical protein